MIFPRDYASTYQFVGFYKVKSVLKMKHLKIKIKMALPSRGTAVGACRSGAGRQGRGAVPRGPAAVLHDGRDTAAGT
jgi:hypothetical protein